MNITKFVVRVLFAICMSQVRQVGTTYALLFYAVSSIFLERGCIN